MRKEQIDAFSQAALDVGFTPAMIGGLFVLAHEGTVTIKQCDGVWLIIAGTQGQTLSAFLEQHQKQEALLKAARHN